MSDLVDSLKTAVVERVTSPILGTFVLSWAACNWRVWVFATERTPAAEKIASIAGAVGWWTGCALPLAFTAIVVLGVPHVQAYTAGVVASAKKKQLERESALRQAVRDEEKVELQLLRSALDQQRHELVRQDTEIRKVTADLNLRDKEIVEKERDLARRIKIVAQDEEKLARASRVTIEFTELANAELTTIYNGLRNTSRIATSDPRAAGTAHIQIAEMTKKVGSLRDAASSALQAAKTG